MIFHTGLQSYGKLLASRLACGQQNEFSTETTMRDIFRKSSTARLKLNGKILELGAKFNSVSLCKAAFGHAGVFANSRALRIAAENKNYDAAAFMLERSGQDFMGPYDFGLGAYWDKVAAIGKQDPKLGAMMEKYE